MASISEELGQEGRRQQVVQQLSEHYANGVLEVEEFERRVEQAQNASDERELFQLVQDLDPRYRPPVEPTEPVAMQQQVTLPVRSSDVPQKRSLLSIFSKVRRNTSWRVPQKLKIVSVMGGTELDFREAILGPGVTEIKVAALMGDVKIIVPPGMPVEIEGTGVMGRFHDYRDPSQRAEGALPVLRLTGLAVMSGVKLQVRLPGETPYEAARRMRQERRDRRLLARRRCRAQLPGS